MPIDTSFKAELRMRRRYRGRLGQVRVYLVKLLRMFLYQKDWMVLPMAALVAGLVGIVVRRRLFLTMEGTLVSSLAVACVCLWNGCFNSIQVICRERDVLKREHRAGLHISSYIAAHMLYQAMLCLLQSAITIYVLLSLGVRFPSHHRITGNFITEFFISIFLITYAADMMALWLSALCRSTTAAMTVMPVVLIVQLVFSGGMMSLPERMEPLSAFTISNVGLKLIAAEADYNQLEMTTAWNTVKQIQGTEIRGSLTVGQIADALGESDNPTVAKLRAIELTSGNPLLGRLTVGDIADELSADKPDAAALRATEIPYETTIRDLLDLVGEDKARAYVVENTSRAAQNPDYTYTALQVSAYWTELVGFALLFALLAVISLEFIDKDKR